MLPIIDDSTERSIALLQLLVAIFINMCYIKYISCVLILPKRFFGFYVLLESYSAFTGMVYSSFLLFSAASGILVGLLLVLTKTYETKGTDLDTVTGSEWD